METNGTSRHMHTASMDADLTTSRTSMPAGRGGQPGIDS